MAVKEAGQAASRTPAKSSSRAKSPATSTSPQVTVAPELIQLLTPEGERTEHPDYPLELSAEHVQALYRDLVLVRRIVRRLADLAESGRGGEDRYEGKLHYG